MHLKILESLTKHRKSNQFISRLLTIVSEAKYETIHGDGIKILSPKQKLQILSITPAQVKVGNTSENLLKEIC